jgi:hypothetical protein
MTIPVHRQILFQCQSGLKTSMRPMKAVFFQQVGSGNVLLDPVARKPSTSSRMEGVKTPQSL